MKIGKRMAAVSGTVVMAAAGLTFATAAAASATTSYGIVEDVTSLNCHGMLWGQKTNSGEYQAGATFEADSLGSINPDCRGWLDQSWDNGKTWTGLIDYKHYASAYGASINYRNDTGSWIRVCVISDKNGVTYCSGWW